VDSPYQLSKPVSIYYMAATGQPVEQETETKTGTSPIDAFTLPHMRAVDREDVRSEQ